VTPRPGWGVTIPAGSRPPKHSCCDVPRPLPRSPARAGARFAVDHHALFPQGGWRNLPTPTLEKVAARLKWFPHFAEQNAFQTASRNSKNSCGLRRELEKSELRKSMNSPGAGRGGFWSPRKDPKARPSTKWRHGIRDRRRGTSATYKSVNFELSVFLSSQPEALPTFSRQRCTRSNAFWQGSGANDLCLPFSIDSNTAAFGHRAVSSEKMIEVRFGPARRTVANGQTPTL